MSKTLTIFTDGACKGNPGPASIGVVVREGDKTVREISKSIGEATNNIAEYTALIYGLQEALAHGADVVNAVTDSELLAKQISGQYKVKNDQLKVLYAQAEHMIKLLKGFTIKHVLRENNKRADELANNAI